MVTSQNGMLTICHGFRQICQHLSCNFEGKTFLSGLIVSVNRRRKDMKVTFVSFGLYAGRFTVECTEYGKTLFYIPFVKFYFGFKDYRVFAVSHRLPASHLLSFEKIENKNFSSNSCFEPNSPCSKFLLLS